MIFVWTLSDVIGAVLFTIFLALLLLLVLLNTFATWKQKRKSRSLIAADREKNK
jgi:predicted membrane protein